MRARSFFVGAVAALAFVVVACDGSATAVQQDAGPTDETPPAVAVNLVRYDVVTGARAVPVDASDDVGVVRTELWADGVKVAESTQAPFTIEWDSTGVADGLVQLLVSAYDAAGNRADTAAVPQFVVNTGTAVVFDEAPELLTGFLEDTFKVPANWNGNSELIDLKYHWTMPAGISRVMTVVMWDGAVGFNLNYSTGTGWCPDSGEELVRLIENDGEILIDHDPGAALAESSWFVHIGAENAADMKGQEAPFKLRVVLFQ